MVAYKLICEFRLLKSRQSVLHSISWPRFPMRNSWRPPLPFAGRLSKNPNSLKETSIWPPKKSGESSLSESIPNVVIDTNVLISAFVFGGFPQRAVQLAFDQSHVYTSPPLLEEYRAVPLELEKKQKISRDQLAVLLSAMAVFLNRTRLVHPTNAFVICRDSKDNMLLDCCQAARADYLITGDKDLFSIPTDKLQEHLGDLSIIRPKTFVQKMSRPA